MRDQTMAEAQKIKNLGGILGNINLENKEKSPMKDKIKSVLSQIISLKSAPLISKTSAPKAK